MSEDELTPEQQFAAESPEKWVPRDLARGRSREDILADLLRLGWTTREATALVEQVDADLDRYCASDEDRSDLIREAFRQMVWGFTLSAIGGGIFVWRVLDESLPVFLAGGGLSMLVVGLVRGSRGYYRWHAYRSDDILP